MDYLREMVAILAHKTEEAAGLFSAEKQKAALDRYCEKALAAWDIIDLSNLPEGDIQIATQKLLLRQLYLPTRILPQSQKDLADALASIEEQRETQRLREAGHRPTHVSREGHEHLVLPSPGERLAVARRLVILGVPVRKDNHVAVDGHGLPAEISERAGF